MNYDQQLARDWLDHADHSPFLDIEITHESITINISKTADEFLKALRDEYGIEYDDPRVILCG